MPTECIEISFNIVSGSEGGSDDNNQTVSTGLRKKHFSY